MAVETLRRPFSADEYQEMVEARILGEEDRVELIEGEVLQMAAIGSRHAACVKRINRWLARQAGEAIVGVQDPVRLGETSVPEPDLSLLRPRADFYAGSHPQAADVLLLVEVSEASVEFDREIKLPLYAQAGIAEVCLVDLTRDNVALYRQPSLNGYRWFRSYQRGEDLEFSALPGARLTVAEVLG